MSTTWRWKTSVGWRQVVLNEAGRLTQAATTRTLAQHALVHAHAADALLCQEATPPPGLRAIR